MKTKPRGLMEDRKMIRTPWTLRNQEGRHLILLFRSFCQFCRNLPRLFAALRREEGGRVGGTPGTDLGREARRMQDVSFSSFSEQNSISRNSVPGSSSLWEIVRARNQKHTLNKTLFSVSRGWLDRPVQGVGWPDLRSFSLRLEPGTCLHSNDHFKGALSKKKCTLATLLPRFFIVAHLVPPGARLYSPRDSYTIA